MANTPNLKKMYQDEVAPALMQKFGYKSVMQIAGLAGGAWCGGKPC